MIPVSVVAAWDGWLWPWHSSGLGEVPSPLKGHKVKEKDLQELHSMLRQGQTCRCPGQTRMKAKGTVHKSNRFIFLLPPETQVLYQPRDKKVKFGDKLQKKSEKETFRWDFSLPR